MGKKDKSSMSSGLGRSLIKNRFGSNKGKKMVANNSMLHTTEIQDGYDWGRLNLQSVTEESSFQEFLSTAELAGTDFQAEKLNIKFVNPRSNVGLLTKDELEAAKQAHTKNKSNLKIPRRPPWNAETSPDELDRNEKEAFLEWRRSLAQLQDEESILLTPYEKNLEFWRQLWRVIERSDVIVQIVDARNPLLFRCEDLELYAKEVSSDKLNLILINKADFLTEKQRQHWADYFESIGVSVVFYSAYLASLDDVPEEEEDESISSKEEIPDNNETKSTDIEVLQESVTNLENAVEENAQTLNKIIDKIEKLVEKTNLNERKSFNSSKLLNREEFIDLLKTIHKGKKVTDGVTTIGLVGYPNVGKSSTINSLLRSKKVSVSATPGKTKHFQTHYLDKDILLCDCPGLVMPSFVFSKAEMILNGILPIDQMRDHVPPTNLLTSQIPRHVIEDKYHIMIPKPIEGEDASRDPTAEELLNAYAYNRGFMTANGQPDNPRAARYVLKDYMNGKLLYCHAPPNVEQTEYHVWPERQNLKIESTILPPRTARAIRTLHATTDDIDKVFFNTAKQGAHTKGIRGIPSDFNRSSSSDAQNMAEKPWKQHNKHKNKGKKEKLRRVYAHLDQH
ncbi:unnamed protein product [Phyllotreta striolata]|uniref:Large subunit GTPase 1 homolog n=1 Tax=Phyllotreta striolata TaxID=444603 RepID=A0A9N9TJ85_PHYSR|nr:unnamed protein product [Phyllotreta striolata]